MLRHIADNGEWRKGVCESFRVTLCIYIRTTTGEGGDAWGSELQRTDAHNTTAHQATIDTQQISSREQSARAIIEFSAQEDCLTGGDSNPAIQIAMKTGLEPKSVELPLEYFVA